MPRDWRSESDNEGWQPNANWRWWNKAANIHFSSNVPGKKGPPWNSEEQCQYYQMYHGNSRLKSIFWNGTSTMSSKLMRLLSSTIALLVWPMMQLTIWHSEWHPCGYWVSRIPDVKAFIKAMARPTCFQDNGKRIPYTITIDSSVKRGFQKWKERTLILPSGRHLLGHCKTWIQDNDLLDLLTMLIQILIQFGFPSEW